MSKASNRKRSKLMLQRKKEREKELGHKKVIAQGLSEIRKRLSNEDNMIVTLKDKNDNERRKVSEVLLEMMDRLLYEARNFEDEKQIVGLGVIAWNLGVFEHYYHDEEKFERIKNLTKKIPLEYEELIKSYSELKIDAYPEYDEVIHDFEFTRVKENKNHLTVSYKSVSE